MCERKSDVARIVNAIGSRSSVHNQKGRRRIASRISREFGDTGIAINEGVIEGIPVVVFTYYVANSDGGFDICITFCCGIRGGYSLDCFEIGSLTRHAALRLVQRGEEPRLPLPSVSPA